MQMQMQSPTLLESSCGYLLQELQIIWDEIGEPEIEREKVLLNVEQQCIEVYRTKVEAANTWRAILHQRLADSEAEFTHLLLSLGERSLPARPEKMTGTLKEQVEFITPALREMRLRKEERVNQFREVQGQIWKLSKEISGQQECNEPSSSSNVTVNETDLSLKRLDEYQKEMQRLQNEKSSRLQRVERYRSNVQNLAATLGVDSVMILTKVHPSLNQLDGICKNISDDILGELDETVRSLEEEKKQRLRKVQLIGKALTDLWDLMDTPYEDRRTFIHITKLLLVSTTEISDSRSLAIDTIEKCEAEVKRLDHLKSSKMKELLLKKRIELEDICNKSHMEFISQLEMDKIINLINSGEIDHAELLTNMDEQISRAKEEAFSRKAIMEKADKWMVSRDEERWLEEYSRDENRYSVSRGAHRNLRRAERARFTVNRISALVDLLITKTKSWEQERNKIFLYDEVPLLEMLMEYTLLRQENEEEKQRQREKKKIPAHTVIERDKLARFRSCTSNNLCLSNQGFNGSFSITNRRLSPSIRKNSRTHKGMFPQHQIAPYHKDDKSSAVSTFSGQLSP